MNQEKIGKFIATCRKEKNMTQEQLAEMLNVSIKSVSRWENGKTMPDISLFKELCSKLNISLNELFEGEKQVDIQNNEYLSKEYLTKYSQYLKRKGIAKRIIIAIIILISICIFIIAVSLLCNKTFFQTTYSSKFLNDVNIPIPRFSYYRRTSGFEEFTTKLKTLKQPDEINVFINQYLNTLERIECQNEVYYYNNYNDFTIIQYRANNDGIGFINTIYISYTKGNICK